MSLCRCKDVREVVQWKDGQFSEMPAWLLKAQELGLIIVKSDGTFLVEEADGYRNFLKDGDYIMKGRQDSIVYCSKQYFEDTYEFIEE